MNDSWKIGLAAAFGILIGASATSVGSQDRTAVVPSTKVLLDNEHVRVQYHDVATGETIPFHSHPATVVYALEPYKAKLKLPNGTEVVREGKAGDTFWSDATTHSVENLGTTQIHNLVVELKHLPGR
jgi:quercetin dioxygenase-like cupin family protein